METNNMSDFEKEFLKMRTSGYAVRDIAKKLRKSTNTICRLNKKYFREISDIKNAKLEELQKLVLDQKKERLDFFKKQLYLLNEKIYRSEIIMKYDNMVKLAIKLSDAINKCEKDTMLDLITPDNNPITNVIDEDEDKITENMELTSEENSSDNKITNNTNFNSENQPKPEKQTENNKNDINSDEKDVNSVIEPPPPRSRADYYLRTLKNKQRTLT